jgi:hypothetical protein
MSSRRSAHLQAGRDLIPPQLAAAGSGGIAQPGAWPVSDGKAGETKDQGTGARRPPPNTHTPHTRHTSTRKRADLAGAAGLRCNQPQPQPQPQPLPLPLLAPSSLVRAWGEPAAAPNAKLFSANETQSNTAAGTAAPQKWQNTPAGAENGLRKPSSPSTQHPPTPCFTHNRQSAARNDCYGT